MTFFDPKLECMSTKELEVHQEVRLVSMFEKLIGRNRFYTEKIQGAGLSFSDLKTREDLKKVPFTTKSELMKAQEDSPPFGTNLTFPESDYTRFHQTSGTTGTPLRVLDTEESWQWWGHCWGFVLAGAGLTAKDRLFVPFSFGPFIGFWAAVEGSREISALMIPGGGRDSLQRLQLMKELGATAMCCTPTYALRLAEVAREENFDLEEIPLKVAVHAGEPGANVPATKSRIENTWGIKCYDHAGASEIGAHSFECEEQPGGIHVNESEFIVEVIDPKTMAPCAEGEEGELVLTNLGRPGFPVLRYRTGDLVRLDRSPCPCGRTFARFEGGVLGRADDMVVIRGVNIYPSAVENLVRRCESVEEFRIQVSKVREMANLEIEIELRPDADSETSKEMVLSEVSHGLGLRPEVKVVSGGTLPRFELKAKRFIKQD